MNRREFSWLMGCVALASRCNVSLAAVSPASASPAFSVMLWSLPKSLSLDQKMELVAAAGYTGIELVGEEQKWSPEEFKSVLRKKAALGLTVDSIAPGRVALADPGARQKLKDQITKEIPLAKELGCNQFIYTAGPRVAGQSPENLKAQIAESLKVAADLCGPEQIEIVLEPIDRFEDKLVAVNSVSEAFEIVRAVNSASVKVLYDFFHEQRGSGNLLEKLDKNIDIIGLVHIADSPGRHQPGTGEVNYASVYRKLAELKYNRYICMEFLPVGDPGATLRAARLQAVEAMKAGPLG